jgi:DHA2 family multidrug resistance protein
MIGETVFVSGLAMFLTAPIAGRLTTKVDPRFMLAAGFLSFAVGSWLMTSRRICIAMAATLRPWH